MDCSIRTNYASLGELGLRDPGAARRWLSPGERTLYESIRAPDRRATFLAGRIAAKRLLMESLADDDERFSALRPADIHIETRSGDRARGERPTVFVRGQKSSWTLSIAHTARGVLVAVAKGAGVTLGVDLVLQDERQARRLNWSFTQRERRWLAAEPEREAGQLWAMKEALYKACQNGEGFAPAQIEVAPDAAPSYPNLRGVVRSLQSWRVDGHFAALTVVETREPGDPEASETDLVLSCESSDD